MAILKHIKSKHMNYASALDYLLYQHDKKHNKPILDEFGHKILREDFYMDGLNCSPLSFSIECSKTNAKFHKNNKKGELKSHHYIISFDPEDLKENHLTGERAQQLCMEFARRNFPGYQALIVTHTDGDNHSGNIHTHIVINSVRKLSVQRQPYMDKPHEEMAGYKHRSTTRFLNYLKQEVMEMCNREGLHQVDLLPPAKEKTSEKEYRAKIREQKKLETLNQEIRDAGMQPTSSTFQTQREFLRSAVSEVSKNVTTFEQFQSVLLEHYNISVINERGRYRYLHPDRDRRITDKALGSHYGKEYLEQRFLQNQFTTLPENDGHKSEHVNDDYRINPIAIFRYKSHLRLVVDLQENVKAIQNETYARKVKITNLQQMAETLIYVQEHGYDCRDDVVADLKKFQKELEKSIVNLEDLSSKIKSLNAQIHYTGQYYGTKNTYSDFIKAKNKKEFLKIHGNQIQQYLEARDWLKNYYLDGKMLSLKSLQETKSKLKNEQKLQKEEKEQNKTSVKELEIILHNIDSILTYERAFTYRHSKESHEYSESTCHNKEINKIL